jgi:DNA-binding PadR family transcriptional regulator
MPDLQAQRLSLSEWLVLCVICEKPAHGFAIAGLLGPKGSLGDVWRVPKAMIYLAIGRLEVLGLVRTVGEERSSHGPARSVTQATPAGRQAAGQWLATPAAHLRDVRSELLVKLALLERAGSDPQPLLLAQQMVLAPVAAALRERLGAAQGFERTLILWRHEAMSATMLFLTETTRSAQEPGLLPAPAPGFSLPSDSPPSGVI